MSDVFEMPHLVTDGEIGRLGHANNVAYLNFSITQSQMRANMQRLFSYLLPCALMAVTGCIGSTQTTIRAVPDDGTSTVLLSVTSDATQDPQAVDMAMKLAGFSLDEGRQVAMFFNVKGVNMPTQAFSDELAFQEEPPLKTQLADLIGRGAEVHVCPICMKALGVEESDLMEGATVTTRAKLFAHIGSDTSVFTY